MGLDDPKSDVVLTLDKKRLPIVDTFRTLVFCPAGGMEQRFGMLGRWREAGRLLRSEQLDELIYGEVCIPDDSA